MLCGTYVATINLFLAKIYFVYLFIYFLNSRARLVYQMKS